MPTTLSRLKFVTGIAAIAVVAHARTGVSGEALSVQTKTASVIKHVEQSESLFGKKSAALFLLSELADECSEPDWDGNDALAISSAAIETAADFIRALPETLPLPELTPEPDGAISLDWIASRHQVFSLSVGANDRIAFAWLDGTDKGHGVARFDGEKIPNRIIQNITEIIGHERTPFRTS